MKVRVFVDYNNNLAFVYPDGSCDFMLCIYKDDDSFEWNYYKYATTKYLQFERWNFLESWVYEV